MPRVLNYRTQVCPDDAVYIGRPMPRFGLPGSKWANPFKLRRGSTFEERKGAIERYERYLHDSGLIDDVHELRGKDLVCWCAPSPCHGDVLLRLANAKQLSDQKGGEQKAR
jgi:hypothetical protein